VSTASALPQRHPELDSGSIKGAISAGMTPVVFPRQTALRWILK
jgi:hypothetical protein